MHNQHYIIIGNGIAGTNCAETLRASDPSCRITLLTGESHALYNRVALPRVLKLQASEAKVRMRTCDRHLQDGIDLRLETRVTHLCPDQKSVLTDTGEEIPYDKLLIATGGRPRRLSVPGGDLHGVMTFQTLDDTRALDECIRAARTAVVAGGSYIAYELADAFRARGLETTWIMRGPRFLHRILGAEGGRIVEAIAADHHVRVVHGAEITAVHGRNGAVTGVATTAGEVLDADIVGLGLGLCLNTDFLAGTGLRLTPGVVTDAQLRTNVPGIYAAGDVAMVYDPALDAYTQVGTWDNASSQGALSHATWSAQGRPSPRSPRIRRRCSILNCAWWAELRTTTPRWRR